MVRSASLAPPPGVSLFVAESNFQHVERGVRSATDDSVQVLKPRSVQLFAIGLFATDLYSLPVWTVAAELAVVESAVAAESGAFPVESVVAEAGESLDD